MDYTRIYWLCFLGFGLLSLVNLAPDLLARGIDGANIVGSTGGVIIVVIALYGVARPATVDGPTRPNALFWGAVLGFVLLFAGTVLEFV
jgi:hypothetical protein